MAPDGVAVLPGVRPLPAKTGLPAGDGDIAEPHGNFSAVPDRIEQRRGTMDASAACILGIVAVLLRNLRPGRSIVRHALDCIDQRIIDVLQQDGRITNAMLSERVNLSPSACLRRVRRLERDGVISGYGARIDPHALGQPCEVFVEITLRRQSEEQLRAFETAVQSCPAVMECHLVSGDADYLLRVRAADPAHYEQVHARQLSRLPGVARIRSSFSLRTVCRRAVMPLPLHGEYLAVQGRA